MVELPTVCLEPMSVADLEKLVKWSNYKECQEFYRHFPPRLEWMANGSFLQTFQANSLAVKQGGETVGLCYLYDNNPTAKSVAVAIIVPHPEHKSITDQVYQLLEQYIFGEKDFQRVEVKILEARAGLRARLEAIGFAVEGLLRRSCRVRGEYHSELLLSRLKGI